MAALKKDYPKAIFSDPQIVTKTFYEIGIVIDGKKHGVKVDPAGNIEDEFTGVDEEHEHAKSKQRERDEEGDND